MDTVLHSQSSPVAIATGFITKKETHIIMQCHDRIFQNVDILDEAGNVLFHGESKGLGSLSWRRTLKDPSGTPIFDLNRDLAYPIKNQWHIQTPIGGQVCTVKHSSWRHRQALTAAVQNLEDNGREVTVELVPKDQAALAMDFVIGRTPVAEIRMAEVNDTSFFQQGDRSVWKARVAGGVDLILLVAIMLCRAELQHTFRE